MKNLRNRGRTVVCPGRMTHAQVVRAFGAGTHGRVPDRVNIRSKDTWSCLNLCPRPCKHTDLRHTTVSLLVSQTV